MGRRHRHAPVPFRYGGFWALLPCALFAACAGKSVEPPAPDPALSQEVAEAPQFTPYEVRPEIRDLARARRIVEAHYPEELRQAGIGGTAVYWVFVDAEGKLARVLLHRSGGHSEINRAGRDALLEIGSEVGFHPARNRNRAVAVWVQQSITFSVRRR